MRHSFAAELGSRLIHIRGSKSQASFAKEIGIHKNTLGNYERGERMPDAEFLLILHGLGYNPSWVLTGKGPKLLKDLEVQKSLAADAGESWHDAEKELDAGLLEDVLLVLREIQDATRKRWLPQKESALAVELYRYINHMETPRPEDRAKVLQLIKSIVGGMADVGEEGAQEHN